MSRQVSARECRKKLAIAWFAVGGLLMAFVIALSLGPRFDGNGDDVWRWFVPTLIPTLSLILGALIVDVRSGAGGAEKLVSQFYYRLTLCLSCGYLVIVALTFLHPYRPIVEMMRLSDFWLEPLQGLVAMALGMFFLSGEQEHAQSQSAHGEDTAPANGV